MKKEELKVGMKVKAVKNCFGVKRGEIYIVEPDDMKDFCITANDRHSWCNCWETWILPETEINPIYFNKGHQPKVEEYPPLADNSKIGL